MDFLILCLIALSLSMDAFSLSIIYGSGNINIKTIKKLSLIVGIYHFVMPIFGMCVGKIVSDVLHLSSHLIVTIIFLIIGIQMIIETFKKNENKKYETTQLALFALAVSMDSFSIGIGLLDLTNNYLLAPILFFIFSTIFTYIGLKLGKYFNKKYGKYATFIGGIILIILGIFHM